MNEKRKILIVAHHLTVGGAQKSMLTALHAIDYEQNDVTLYLRKKRLDMLPQVDPRVTVIANEDSTHYYRKPYALWALLRMKLCRKEEKRAELHAQLSERIREDMLRYESARYFAGKHFDVAIAYIQGYSADIVADGVEADRKYLFYHSSTDEAHELHDRIFGAFDEIVGVNAGVRDVLRGLYPKWQDKMTYLCNYVDAAEVIEKSRVSVERPEGMLLCSCGRVAKVKGYDMAIEAAVLLKQKGVSFTWWIVGDGPERPALEEKIAALNLQNTVIITGMEANPYPRMAVCDIYVQPSYEEAHPMTLLEAQILCRPVVSTETVGGKALVAPEKTGLLCEISAADLAAKLERLMTDAALRSRMTEALAEIDHTNDEAAYRESWAKLLAGTFS